MALLVKLKQKCIDLEDQDSCCSELRNTHKQLTIQDSDQIDIQLESKSLKSNGINQQQNDTFKGSIKQENYLNSQIQSEKENLQNQGEVINGIHRVQSHQYQDKLKNINDQGDVSEQLDLDIDLSQQQLKVDIQECNKQIKYNYYLKNDPKLNKQRRYRLLESICSAKIETNFFCWRSKNNDTDQLSLQSLLYLNQIKSLLCLFFILFILSLPTFYICAKISKDLHYEYINDFQSFFLYPTIAGIGYKFWQCDMFIANKTSDQTIDLKCSQGILDFKFAQIGLTNPDDTQSIQGCEFIELQKVQVDCLKIDINNSTSYNNIYNRCQYKNACQISSIEILTFFKDDTDCDNNIQQQNMFISVPCRNQNVDIFGIPISNYHASITIILLQTFGIILFLLFFLHQCFINKTIRKRIKNKIALVQKHSLEVQNIPKMHFNWTQELLWLHLQRGLNEYTQQKQEQEIKIIDIQMALPECLIQRDLILKQQIEKIQNKVIRFINQYDPDSFKLGQGINRIQIDQLRKIFDFVSNPKTKKKCYKDLMDIVNSKQKIEKLKEQIKCLDNSQTCKSRCINLEKPLCWNNQLIITFPNIYLGTINFHHIQKVFNMISPTVNCYEYRSVNQSVLSQDPQDLDQVYCFCSTNAFSDEQICLQIFQMAQLKKLYPFFIMLILNIAQVLLVKLTKYCVKKLKLQNKIEKDVLLFQLLVFIKILNNVVLYYLINKLPLNQGKTQNNSFGNYVDFSPEWYRNVGMFFCIHYLIKICLYIIQNITQIIYRKIRLHIDHKCKKKKAQTYQKTNFDYIHLHQGPEFQIACSYSEVFEYIFVTMVLGFGIPFFYFITFLFLVFHIYFEKYYSIVGKNHISTIVKSLKISWQNTDANNSQVNDQQDQDNAIPIFNPQNFQPEGSYFIKISTYTYLILFLCFYFREKIISMYQYLSYISKYDAKRKAFNNDSQIKKLPFNYKPLYQLYSIRQLQELSQLQEYYIEKEVSDIRKQRFINKKKEIDQVIKSKLDENLDLDYSEKPVSGCLSYDIMVNPNYSRYFDWKTDLIIFKMNKVKKEEICSKLTQSVAVKKQIQGVQNKQSAFRVIQQFKRQINSRYQSFKDSKKNETTNYTEDNLNQIKLVSKSENDKQQQEKQQNQIKNHNGDLTFQGIKDIQNEIIDIQILSSEDLVNSIKRIDHHNTVPQFYQFFQKNLTLLQANELNVNKPN
ncbi:transmembrane protein, putative (macronuclear) [Tetrahymena thermophila SB210]|uniref:Transmembrane protein, putative n=1 Tax=Tetrahymena thermophila (strain SB210) TaxID=312017 RepID=W7XGT2_TETTS|nr:transmembrane protein, putative [Tetrahymena thermophila SB210]EWS73426.1 transmembrane protein, putative [Tetrahymena thermophila SB210]|eukprot:XP_012654042.1 transmembrane protein, putative [Tetrahymena thermophila SB210]